MKDNRPVNLDLMAFKFPMPAISSILHRMSGVILFLLLPYGLWMLQQSLRSAASYAKLQQCLHGFVGGFFLWVFAAAAIYHFLAGVRHLLMDMGIGETLEGGRRGAVIVLVLSFILIIALGVYLCQ